MRYEGRCYPAEIGMAEVQGIAKMKRKTLLVAVDNRPLQMSKTDRAVNRVVCNRISKLPMDFIGDVPQKEAERRARDFVPRGSLVTAKGLQEKAYFRGLGFRVLEMKSEVLRDCPKFKDLPFILRESKLRHGTDYHYESSSRTIALAFAKYIEWRVLSGKLSEPALSEPVLSEPALSEPVLSEPFWDDFLEPELSEPFWDACCKYISN
ncbi:hypothetical protein AVEN_1436-1 [Araneus ventricosus]|uniref:Uncharacterized protein n=1 Tax=Araneus ventricosus TaxID=182803 RepID=A0A4Y2SGB0_ARAVE|nr:hypothetical protein AVEN_1436-1 [Araneus ventricosus]